MIETRRLLLRPFTALDEEAFLPSLMCSEFMVHSPSGALDKDDAQARFRGLVHGFEENGFGKLAVIESLSEKIIGYCGTEVCTIDGQYVRELGFRLIAGFRGKGYATEAARAILNFERERGLTELIAFTELGYIASMNVLAKLGFLKNGNSHYFGMPVILFKLTI